MNFLETDSHTVTDRSYYNENLLYNNELSTEHKTLSFLNEIAVKEDTERVYALYCYCVNLYFNEENQI